MWVWWFFWVYGFNLLEVSVEDAVWIWKMWTSPMVAVACSKRRISCPWVGIWICLKLTWVGIWVCLRLLWLSLFRFGYPYSCSGFMNFICWRFRCWLKDEKIWVWVVILNIWVFVLVFVFMFRCVLVLNFLFILLLQWISNNILIPSLVTLVISVCWLMEMTKIAHVNWFRD